jgi:hypothetical protein
MFYDFNYLCAEYFNSNSWLELTQTAMLQFWLGSKSEKFVHCFNFSIAVWAAQPSRSHYKQGELWLAIIKEMMIPNGIYS